MLASRIRAAPPPGKIAGGRKRGGGGGLRKGWLGMERITKLRIGNTGGRQEGKKSGIGRGRAVEKLLCRG